MRRKSNLMTPSARGKVSPVLIVLVLALVAAGGGLMLKMNKGKSAEDWRVESQTREMVGKTLQEAKDYFGDQNPTLLPPDPNAAEGAEPTARHYVFAVQAGGETLYFYIMHNFSLDRIVAHNESDIDGPFQ